MICGGRLRRCYASSRVSHALIDHKRSNCCKARWKPLSENSSGFGPRRVRWHQCQQAFKHIGERGFTRQRDREADEMDRRASGFNYANVWLRFRISKSRELHHLGWIDLVLRE